MLKSKRASLAAWGALVIVILVGFENCGYFSSYKVPKQLTTDNSSVAPGIPGYIYKTGEFQLTDAGKAAGLNMTGRALMVSKSDGTKTEVYTSITGMTPSTVYMAHVHDLPCKLGGGAHYKIDPSIATAIESNEIWPGLTTDAAGDASGYAAINVMARPEAQSIVIHDPATPATRLACADLNPERRAVVKGGRFVQTVAGTTLAINPIGNGVIVRNANNAGQTMVRYSVGGLSPATAYAAHVHAQACALADGGPHYKQNLLVVEGTASQANELWPGFTTDATGRALVSLSVDGHVARSDAASIVIHYPVNPLMRLACLDLATDAGFVTTVAGLTANLLIQGSAQLTHRTNGETEVAANLTGLTPNTAYMAHVHDHPCGVNGGGGHYKIDPTVVAALESNEMWLMLNADATGAARASVLKKHIARPSAQSIVIHDPVTPATRLACVDLY